MMATVALSSERPCSRSLMRWAGKGVLMNARRRVDRARFTKSATMVCNFGCTDREIARSTKSRITQVPKARLIISQPQVLSTSGSVLQPNIQNNAGLANSVDSEAHQQVTK